ncbi:hypothetical protein SUGI_0046300 [Cryptomeria japonica]|nr:hypothetical protein SUGI_0046300 [Cryptomeria japonica]
MRNYSQANITFVIPPGGTFWKISTENFEHLTTYQAVEIANPTLVPENLTIGTPGIFPIRCQCPSRAQISEGIKMQITYVVQEADTLESISEKFDATLEDLKSANGALWIYFYIFRRKRAASIAGQMLEAKLKSLGREVSVESISRFENGSLNCWCHDPESISEQNASTLSFILLSWKIRLQIALDVAKGLQYIHDYTTPGLMKKDVKSSNILLAGSFRAKIANFGMAESGINILQDTQWRNQR